MKREDFKFPHNTPAFVYFIICTANKDGNFTIAPAWHVPGAETPLQRYSHRYRTEASALLLVEMHDNQTQIESLEEALETGYPILIHRGEGKWEWIDA